MSYHNINLIDTTLSNSRRDKLGHFPIAQVHVRIKSRRELELFESAKIHDGHKKIDILPMRELDFDRGYNNSAGLEVTWAGI